MNNIAALEKEIEELERLEQGNPEPEVEEEEVEEVVEDTPEEPSSEEKTWKERYSNLRRLQQKQAEELKQIKSAPPATQSSITKEQVEAWVKDNPKAADIVRALAKEVSPLEDVTQIQEEIAHTKSMSKILKSHADFEEITSSDEFHEWADKQPANVQSLVFSSNAEDVIWALNFYKSTLGEKTDPKKNAAKLVKTKTGAEQPADTGSKTYSESMVEKMSLEEYEKHEKAILEAQKSGKFVYDRSGGAR